MVNTSNDEVTKGAGSNTNNNASNGDGKPAEVSFTTDNEGGDITDNEDETKIKENFIDRVCVEHEDCDGFFCIDFGEMMSAITGPSAPATATASTAVASSSG